MGESPLTRGGVGIDDELRVLLKSIASEVVRQLGADAVVLYGSFSRGEGGAYRTQGTLRVANDFDLIAVYEGLAQIPRALFNRAYCQCWIPRSV